MQKSRSYVQKLSRLHVLGDDQTLNLFFNFISAKWCHFTFTSVKLENFTHLLKKIGSAKLNAVKECRLLKPPLWKEKALRMSFKTYSKGDLQRACQVKNLSICTCPKRLVAPKKLQAMPLSCLVVLPSRLQKGNESTSKPL